ncbi:hypothetical protein GCU60_12430 [Blastococcus saxobsidens]|uniref:Uncharacterized protein n=1 Tax=Blastococcus saxobsidens TaxID=138336 RepID=A0A6L9W3H3_9ACTN|nr:hypothetical protein [Blastococcus saxobsidens]NEK86553.1 hypothetical protein [Blastococcus saxobsidens]
MSRLRPAGWALAAALVAGWLAVVEVFWLPLRAGGVLVPVSVLAAVVGNVLLVRAAARLSGARWVAVVPAVVWLGVVVAAMGRRPEGDLVVVLAGGAASVVNAAFLLLGVLAAAAAAGTELGAPARPVSPPPVPTGSGSGGAR